MRITLIVSVLILTVLVFFAAFRFVPTVDSTPAVAALEQATAENEAIKADLAEKTTAFTTQISDLTEQTDTLSTQLSEVTDQAAALSAQIAELEAENASKTQEIEDLGTQRDMLAAERDQLVAKRDEIAANLDQATQQIAEAEAASAANANQQDALIAENSELSAQLTTLQNAYDALSEAAITENAGDVVEAEVVEGLNDQIATLEAEITNLETERASLESRIADLEISVVSASASANDQVIALQAQVEEQAAALAALSAQDPVRGQLSGGSVQAVAEMAAQLSNFEGQVAALTLEAANLSRTIAARDREIAALLADQNGETETQLASCQDRTTSILAETPIAFEADSSSFVPDATATLDALAVIAIECGELGFSLEIEGYSDGAGDSANALLLSTARARSVYDYLVASGAAPETMRAVGFGGGDEIAVANLGTGQRGDQPIILDWERP